MIRAGKKLFRLFATIFAVSAVAFFIVDFLPGDAAYEIAGMEAGLEDVEAIREELGLNRPVFVRYGIWLIGLLRGDLGVSFGGNQPVLEAIITRLPVTLELMLVAQAMALFLAIPSGIACAARQGSAIDKSLTACGFALMSVPVFAMALVLIYVFALHLKWFPAVGYIPLSESVWGNLRCFVLPAGSIALVEWVPLMRVLRSDMISTLREDYILAARAKGLPGRHILLKHAFRPSSLTLLTLLGIHAGHLIGGSLIVEIAFALPGMGRLLVEAIYGRDLQMVQGCVLLISAGYVAINFTVDMAYDLLDPGIRSGRTA